MIPENRKQELEKQGYRFVGNHSAVKICLWCRNGIRGKGSCYKHKFYGIDSWRCIQVSVSMDICPLRCNWCWRDVDYSFLKYQKVDEPKNILDGFIREHVELLKGFGGLETRDEKRFKEAMEPRHVALSLAGETCLYPKLPELVKEIHSRKTTSFIVSNGTVPDMVKKLTKTQPTQMYVTLPAPDEKTFLQSCRPLIPDAWEKIQQSLQLLEKFNRSVVRLTLAKDMNLKNPEGYAKILNQAEPKWIEIKAAMPVGYAQHRMKYSQMARHQEIKNFSKKICKLIGLKILDEKKESRVVLVGENKKDLKIGD